MNENQYLCVRLDTSSYYPDHFFEQERNALKKYRNIQYLNTIAEINESSLIFLSNTHSDLSKLPKHYKEKIELIIHANSGTDNLDFNELTNPKAIFIAGNSLRAPAVSEYSIACLFKHFCNIPFTPTWDKKRQFPNRKLIHELDILIIGFGQIGSRVYSGLKSLGVTLHVHDPFKETPSSEDIQRVKHLDAIIVCSELTKSSYQLVDANLMDKLNHGGAIINASRGKVIQQDHLIQFLKDRQDVIAYLDVFHTEPFKDEFTGLSNVYTSSHIAGVYDNLAENMIKFEAQVIGSYLSLTRAKFLETYKDIAHEFNAN